MRIQDEQSLTQYKLIILYMLKVIDSPLTNAQISDFLLGKGYTDYFTVQESISDLAVTEMINCEKILNSSRYTITEEGEKILEIFMDKISPAIRDDIKDYMKENSFKIKESNSCISDYYNNMKDEYIVHLLVEEDKEPLIDVKLCVPTEEMAIKMCANWKEKNTSIYSFIMNELAGDK